MGSHEEGDYSARLEEALRKTGFLSPVMSSDLTPMIRSSNQELFHLAEDTNLALMQLAHTATQKAVGVLNWSKESLAARILLRSCGLLQGVILLTERGMVVEGRTLTRSLLECSFCVAALLKEPDAFIDLLKRDSQASRRRQGKFIIDFSLGAGTFDKEKLKSSIDEIDKTFKNMDLKSVAALSPMIDLYLEYQRLSDESAHLSARSLQRHLVTEDKKIIAYQSGPGNPEENAATLHRAVMASLPVGIAVCDLFQNLAGNTVFEKLAERFVLVPRGAQI